MLDKIKVFALGGLDENGRDCYIVEINDDIFVLDCGASLPDKNIPGVDALLPNVDYLIKNAHRVRAFIMSHGHDEQMAALKYIYKYVPVPVYTTRQTRNCIVGQAAIYKINHKINFVEIGPNDTVMIAGRQFDFFQTTHNAAYSFGVAIHTTQGNIVYSGDFIVDFSTDHEDFLFNVKRLESISETPTLLLMADSKAANKEGYCSPRHRVTPKIEKFFREDERIFICCFWQNAFRIKEILNLVKENKKKLYFYDSYTESVMKIIFPDIVNEFIARQMIVLKEELLRVRTKDLVIIMLGHGKELYDEIINIAKGENINERIRLSKNDIFINCALATPTLEVAATRSMDTLYRSGCTVVWLKPKDTNSMHARQDDLKFFLSCLRPKYYLPVRGHFTHLMANAKLALSMGIGLNHMNVFVFDNGMQLLIDENGKARVLPNEVTGIDVSPSIVDGKTTNKLANSVIEDRVRLSTDGVVVVAATISHSSHKIIAGPDCQMRGFVFVKEAEPLLRYVTQTYVDEVNNVLDRGNFNFDKAIEIIKDKSKRFIKRENGREPLVVPIVIQVD